MAFTEFYCNASTGNNMNGGSDENTSPSYSSTNGGWDSTTGVFTPTSGDPSASGVTVGQFAHVFTDGSTTPGFVGRVTAVNSTTVTVSITAKSGTIPTTGASGLSINVGGVWKGPNAAVAFPATLAAAAVNASGDYPRINLKNNATYSITAVVSQTAGWVEGYTTTPGDGGRAVVEGPASGTSIQLWVIPVATTVKSMRFQQNGTTGTAQSGLNLNGNECQAVDCVVTNVRKSGIVVTGSLGHIHIIGCETYGCNTSNTSGGAGIEWGNATTGDCQFCISHDNTGANNQGFVTRTTVQLIHCIADSNGASGFSIGGTAGCVMINCDAYNNTGNGISLTASSDYHSIINCNLVKNGGYGISAPSNLYGAGVLLNNGFGSGTFANTSGDTNNFNIGKLIQGNVTYPSNTSPYVDADNGDFRLNIPEAKGTGYSGFVQTASSYAGTIGYLDIGAAQHQDTGGSSVKGMRILGG